MEIYTHICDIFYIIYHRYDIHKEKIIIWFLSELNDGGGDGLLSNVINVGVVTPDMSVMFCGCPGR